MPDPLPGHGRCPIRGPAASVLGITLFRPRPDQLARVRALASAGYAAVIAFDNGGLPAGAADQLARSGVTLLSEGANLGIAEALNRIAASARAAGPEPCSFSTRTPSRPRISPPRC